MYEKIYELEVQLYLNKNIKINDSYEYIGEFINYSMNKSKTLQELHSKHRAFKHYCFSGMYPVETDMIYKEGEIYNILIRSYKWELLNEFKKNMVELSNDNFCVINVNTIKEYHKQNIEYIDTLTPTIVTVSENNKSKCWNIKNDNLEYFNQAIFNNLSKKYNDLQGINQTFNYEDIIDDIEIKNKYAIITNYKGIKFLGYKIRIYFKDNNIAQEFANLSIAEGVGEKNSSIGHGFTKPYFRRK